MQELRQQHSDRQPSTTGIHNEQEIVGDPAARYTIAEKDDSLFVDIGSWLRKNDCDMALEVCATCYLRSF